MKEKEVPQDDGMLQGKTRDLYYVLDENGNYVNALSTGWEPKNIVMQQAWDIINEAVAGVREQVLRNEASTLLYHMEKNQMDVKLLSQYSGVSKAKIKEHIRPGGLEKATQAEKEAYADSFRISVEQLLKLDDSDSHHA